MRNGMCFVTNPTNKKFQLAVCTLLCSALAFVTVAGAQEDEEKHVGTDKTVYVRPTVPEDFVTVPRTQMNCEQRDAFSSCVLTDIVSTDAAQNGKVDSLTEPSIAINSMMCNGGGDNCTELVIATADAKEDWANGKVCKDNGNNDRKCTPIWHSTNGGTTWTKRYTVPPPPGRAVGNCPCDTTVDYLRLGTLVATFLVKDDIFTGTTTNAADSRAWNWNAPAGTAQKTNIAATDTDQPWALANPSGLGPLLDMTYVSYYKVVPGRTAQTSVSFGTNPPNFQQDNSPGGLAGFTGLNPGVRAIGDAVRAPFPAYTIFQTEKNRGVNGTHTVSYVLNRSNSLGLGNRQAAWPLRISDAGCDDADFTRPVLPPPCVIAIHQSDQTGPMAQGYKFGTVNALRGGIDHLGVDPNNGDLYAVYGDRDAGTGSNALDILRLGNNGKGGLKAIGGPTLITPIPVQAALPSVAVTANGTVGVAYYTFDGCSKTDVKTDPLCNKQADTFAAFTVHLAISTDHAQTFTDYELVSFLSPAQYKVEGANPFQRVLGDFQQLRALGNTFYGTFAANGATFARQCGANPCAISDAIFLKATLK